MDRADVQRWVDEARAGRLTFRNYGFGIVTAIFDKSFRFEWHELGMLSAPTELNSCGRRESYKIMRAVRKAYRKRHPRGLSPR